MGHQRQETVTADNADTERKDFEEQSESVEVTGIRKDSTSENTGLTPDEVNNAILSGCSKNRQQDISSELACTSRMLSVQETENDEISLNKTRANDKKSIFVSVCDSEKNRRHHYPFRQKGLYHALHCLSKGYGIQTYCKEKTH